MVSPHQVRAWLHGQQQVSALRSEQQGAGSGLGVDLGLLLGELDLVVVAQELLGLLADVVEVQLTVGLGGRGCSLDEGESGEQE